MITVVERTHARQTFLVATKGDLLPAWYFTDDFFPYDVKLPRRRE